MSSRVDEGHRPSFAVRSWPIWSQPSHIVIFLVSIELFAVMAIAASLTGLTVDSRLLFRAGLLFATSVAFEEVARRVHRLRFRLTEGAFIDLTSVWLFAAAVCLPMGYGLFVLVGVRTHVWFRKNRPSGMRLYRQVYTAAAMVLAYVAARTVIESSSFASEGFHRVVGVMWLLVAIGLYAAVNLVLVVTAMYLALRPAKITELLGSWDDYSIELATLCLGSLVGLAAIYGPMLIALAIPPMLLLQRSALVKQLERLATIDAKTGLLNAVAWQQIAQREISRADREATTAAVLLVDLDHFKAVNDSYGHLLGDAALLSVGSAITSELRDYDSVGRFGGEEFVAVLPDVTLEQALVAAERVRARIATLRISDLSATVAAPEEHALSASVGVACYPAHGADLQQVLHEADAALYVAKRAGRNRVEVASPPASDGVAVMS